MSRHAPIAVALALAACTDVPQPFDLDHPRVMAVRLDPPALEADARARIEVLVTDASTVPRLAGPDDVDLAPPPGLTLERDAEAWYVRAPSASQLAEQRRLRGLAPEAPLVVVLGLAVASDAGPLLAQKTLLLDARAANPVPPRLAVDGREAVEVRARVGTDVVLGVMADDAALSYRWFSSVGDLVGYTRAEARLEPVAGNGLVVVVVRDQAGGTAWTIADARVEP